MQTKWHGVAASLLLLALPAAAQQAEVLGRAVPPEIMNPPWLEDRMAAQLATRDDFVSRIDFTLTDRAAESWIAFRNRVVDDAGMTYKAVHYDHGNGVAVADVDSDGLHDILFLNQVGANELWRNIGGGRFVDITGDSGIAATDRVSVAASFADIDNDGDADLYITTVREGNLLFENDGKGRFTNITGDSGLGYKGHSSGAVFFDYNRDGLLDLYLTNVGQYTSTDLREGNHEGIRYTFYDGLVDAFSGHRMPERNEMSRLYRNDGDNRFSDVTEIMEDAAPSWSGDASIIDVNGDGWPDLYVLNMQGHDEYYENESGKRFVRRSRSVFPKTSWGAMGIKVFDWNNDGDLDIYITDMHSDMSQIEEPTNEHRKADMQWDEDHLMSGGNSIFGNTFFDNTGKGRFREISDNIGVENFWPWGLSVGDLNADGFQDIFVTASMNYPFRYQTNSVLINERGKTYRAAEFLLGVEPRRGGRTARPWFGLDCTSIAFQWHGLCREAGPVVLEVWGALGSRSSVIFDLDNDGDLDIVTNESNSEPLVLVSDLADNEESAVNAIEIDLEGTESNRQGIGARVVVVAGELELTQVMDGKSGYLSQSDLPLYFGLGEQETVDAITITWPSGTVQKLGSTEANQRLVVREPGE